MPFTSTNLQTALSQPGVSAYLTSGQGGRPTTIAVNRTGLYVRVQLAGTNSLGLAEVEVFGPGAGSGPADVCWLVSDQLGTPRMVIAQAGTLASVSRRDFLPFGEELYAGGRTYYYYSGPSFGGGPGYYFEGQLGWVLPASYQSGSAIDQNGRQIHGAPINYYYSTSKGYWYTSFRPD